MGAIAGIFRLDGRPAAAADVRQMRAASALPACEPLVAPSTAVWFDGRLYNRDDLARFCPTPSDPLVTDAALALATYRERGDLFAAELNGDFAVVIVDDARHQVILARDVMASRPLYYCPLVDGVVFASHMRSILANPNVSAAPDEDGLAELVLDNWSDGHRTCFKGVYSVPPGHAVVVTRDGVATRPHWTFDPARQIRYRSFDDYRDHFKTAFDEAVRRRVHGATAVAVTVSGGLDSSSIFCQAAQLRRRESTPFTLHGVSMTFPPGTPADEREYLEAIERAYDSPIAKLRVSEYRYAAYVDTAVRSLDTPGDASASELDILRTAQRAGCDVLLSGFFGDQVLCDRGYMVDLARSGRWTKIRHDLNEFAAWAIDVDPACFRRDFWRYLLRGLAPRSVLQLGKTVLRQPRARQRYPHWYTAAFRQRAVVRAGARFRRPRRFASFHAEQLYRHATAGHYINLVRRGRALAEPYGIDVRYPFRDRDLVAFLMAIPGEVVNWQGVPKGLLRHALEGVLPDAVRQRRSKADFTALENQAMRRDAGDVAALVRPDSLSVRYGFVDPAALERLPSTYAHMNDDDGALPGWRLTDLAGLELWLRHFFGSRAVADERRCTA